MKPFRRSAVVRATVALAGVLLAAVIAYIVGARVAHIDVAALHPVAAPSTPSPAPARRPIADVGRAALTRVVTIESLIPNEEALGTGWLFDGRGDFVTNAHVVTGHLSVRITDRDDHIHVATVIGTDPAADIAVVRSSDGFLGQPLPVDHT